MEVRFIIKRVGKAAIARLEERSAPACEYLSILDNCIFIYTFVGLSPLISPKILSNNQRSLRLKQVGIQLSSDPSTSYYLEHSVLCYEYPHRGFRATILQVKFFAGSKPRWRQQHSPTVVPQRALSCISSRL